MPEMPINDSYQPTRSDLYDLISVVYAPDGRVRGRRCRAIVIRDSIQDECHAAIYFQYWPGQPRWVHVHNHLDDDHQAEYRVR